MKTFPHINFNTMNTLHTKCKQIIKDLDSMIPEDSEVSDWYKVKGATAVTGDISTMFYKGTMDFGIEVGRKLDLSSVTITNFKQGVVSYFEGRWLTSQREILSKGLEVFLIAHSHSMFVRPTVFVSDYKKLPEYSFYKTIHDTCKKILGALQSESCVNTLNLELSAALQFIEELEEVDWKKGLKSYDKESVTGELEDLKQKAIDDAKEECKNNYEIQIAEFKAKLEVLEKTPKKPEEEFIERHRKEYPSFWESFKNMFK